MKLIIEIPDGMYKEVEHENFDGEYSVWDLCDCIKSGVVLPEKRERLADDDLINRQELIRKLKAWDYATNGIPNYAWKVINELPPVKPEPKTGRWISNAEDDLKISEYICSNCKGLSDEDTNFCPKCGSKMQEVEE